MIDDPTLKKLRETASKANDRKWYADKRHITLCPDKQAMGASLPTNHIAVFSDADDAAHAAAANPHTVLALLSALDRAKQLAREACSLIDELTEDDPNRAHAVRARDIAGELSK